MVQVTRGRLFFTPNPRWHRYTVTRHLDYGSAAAINSARDSAMHELVIRWLNIPRLLRSFALQLTIAAGLSSPARGDEAITISSWNIANLHHVPGYAYRGEIGTWRTFADLAIIKKILVDQKPGVILLQEASGELAVRDVLGDDYAIIGTREYDARRDNDNLLQRDVYPFIAVRRELEGKILYQFSTGLSDGLMPSETRDIQYVRLQVGSKTLGLIHIHGKSSCPDTVKIDSDNRSCQLIYKQFLSIGDLIKKEAGQDDAVLVVGDFNRELLNPRLLEWRKTYAPWAASLIAPPACILRPSLQPIDFVIVSKLPTGGTIASGSTLSNLLPTLDHPARISDHCPLSIRVDFK